VAQTDTSTTIEERTEARLDDGDHERLAHYVPKGEIVRSAVTGEPVTALCGKRWVPSRDPERFPVCPECKAIFEAAKSFEA
jgi:hypothetical protein